MFWQRTGVVIIGDDIPSGSNVSFKSSERSLK